MEIGSTLQFTATGTFSDGSTQPLTSGVTWAAVGSPANATINSGGLATGTTAGTAVITATDGSVSDAVTLTVTASSTTTPTTTPDTTPQSTGPDFSSLPSDLSSGLLSLLPDLGLGGSPTATPSPVTSANSGPLPGQGRHSPAWLNLEPTSTLVPGQEARATGGGCDAQSAVLLTVNRTRVGSARANTNGSFSTRIYPSALHPGEHELKAACGPTMTASLAMVVTSSNSTAEQIAVALAVLVILGVLLLKGQYGSGWPRPWRRSGEGDLEDDQVVA